MVLQLVKSPTTTNGGAEDIGRAAASLREEIGILRRALYISERSLSAQGEEGGPAEPTDVDTEGPTRPMMSSSAFVVCGYWPSSPTSATSTISAGNRASTA